MRRKDQAADVSFVGFLLRLGCLNSNLLGNVESRATLSPKMVRHQLIASEREL